MRLLLVDDEPDLLAALATGLRREGYAVDTAGSVAEASEHLTEHPYDLVCLDLGLPDGDGRAVCRAIRGGELTVPDAPPARVLMLTARDGLDDRVGGLDDGADDYLVKPFSPRELVARIKALLRRPRSTGGEVAEPPPGLAIDEARRTVRVDETAIELTALEFDLLATLARDPGVVVGRQALLDRVWGSEYVGDEHLVDVHIANLRRKLGDDPAQPRFVETVRGVGYRLREGE